MSRELGTDYNGNPFSNDVKDKVWAKVPRSDRGLVGHLFKNDKCDAPMRYSSYGDRDSEDGWEIDHINPVENGGTDDIENLQALNWRNNAGKSDNYPVWYCTVPNRKPIVE